jgi:hypothetical protein
MKNVSALQEQVLLYVHDLITVGLHEVCHGEIADACRVGVGTVKDALRRAQALACWTGRRNGGWARMAFVVAPPTATG